MKAYSLLYLSLFSFVTISACKPSRTAQTEKMKDMEKKELKMLENSQAKSEEEALEISFGPSHEGLVNWVLSDTATFSYPFTRSIEKEYVTIATSADRMQLMTCVNAAYRPSYLYHLIPITMLVCQRTPAFRPD